MSYPGSAEQYPAGYDHPVSSVAQYFLSCIESVYTEAGIELPTARLIVVGAVAVESEVLAVMFGGVKTGSPGNERIAPGRLEDGRTAVFNVELWRTLPGATSPAPLKAATTNPAASRAMDDAWMLIDAAHRADQLNVGVSASSSVHEPTGDMQGVSLQCEIQVP